MSTHEVHNGLTFDELYAVSDNVIRLSELSREERLELICHQKDCAQKFAVHRGYDSACPHPEAHELGKPLFIEGQFFSAVPRRCANWIVQSVQDESGRPCLHVCRPGKEFCDACMEEQ